VLRLLITDDHAIVRQGIKRLLAEALPTDDIDEAGDGHEMLEKCRRRAYDVVLLDVSMPGLGGMEALREVKRMHPALPVLIFTMHPEEQLAVRMIKAGAAGYVQKTIQPEELAKAVSRVARGMKYITPTLADKLAGALGGEEGKTRHERLSNREYQVLQALGSGKASRDIARDLGLSVKTVQTLRQRTLAKMGMKNNAELIRYSIESGICDPGHSGAGTGTGL
jgi:two-component system, NarL family, invasion response regulator UvrY